MDIEKKIIAIVRENIEKRETVLPESDLREELGIDSFETIMIINGLEEAFGVTVDEADFESIRTVGDIVSVMKTTYLSR